MQTKHLLYISLGLLVFGLFSSLNTLELRGMEPIRALVSLEMNINDDLVRPTLTGTAYYHKPPFFNWYLIVYNKYVGDWSEDSIRAPSIVAYLTTAILMYFFLRLFIEEKIALLSSLFFLSGAGLLFYGTVYGGEMDLFLILPVFCQIIILPILYEKKKWFEMFLVSYLFASIVFLTKHFAVLAIQFIALLSLVISVKKWKVLFSWAHFSGILIFIALVGCYFLSYSKNGELEPFLANLILETTDKSHSGNFNSRIIQLFNLPIVLIKILLPWSLLLSFMWNKKNNERF